MERRTDRSDTAIPRSETIVDARTSLALWLRAGRMQRGMTLDAVAKVTKIQARILERLETGRPDGLPAEVFVRGFVRSFARCVGLDEDEALRRYAACGANAQAELTPTVRALVEAMVELAPGKSTPRATPRRMQAVHAIEGFDLEPGAVVETMMLPETGTLVIPVMPIPVMPIPVIPIPVMPMPMPMAAEPIAAEPMVAEPIAAEPMAAEPVEPIAAVEPAPIEVIEVAAIAEPAKRKRGRRGGKNRKKPSMRLATGTPAEASPVVAPPTEEIACEASHAEEIPPAPVEIATAAEPEIAPVIEAPALEEPIATAIWSPKMPPIATPSSSVPWRRPAYVTTAAPVVPSLVIDDADPDSAERVLEERAEKHTPRRSFLPPILLDREDRSARQGGLTLAVIILLVAATLTLSYLMRRPGAPGDGMTQRDAPAHLDSVG
jgi:hypothetical protein